MIKITTNNNILKAMEQVKDNKTNIMICPELYSASLDKLIKSDFKITNIKDINIFDSNSENIIKRMEEMFISSNSNNNIFYLEQGLELVRNSIYLIKTLKNDATIHDLYKLTHREQDGRVLVNAFSKLSSGQMDFITDYFENDYFLDKSKTFYNTSSSRNFITSLLEMFKNTEKPFIKTIINESLNVFTYKLDISDYKYLMYMTLIEQILIEYILNNPNLEIEIMIVDNKHYEFNQLRNIADFITINDKYFKDYYSKDKNVVYVDFNNNSTF